MIRFRSAYNALYIIRVYNRKFIQFRINKVFLTFTKFICIKLQRFFEYSSTKNGQRTDTTYCFTDV